MSLNIHVERGTRGTWRRKAMSESHSLAWLVLPHVASEEVKNSPRHELRDADGCTALRTRRLISWRWFLEEGLCVYESATVTTSYPGLSRAAASPCVSKLWRAHLIVLSLGLILSLGLRMDKNPIGKGRSCQNPGHWTPLRLAPIIIFMTPLSVGETGAHTACFVLHHGYYYSSTYCYWCNLLLFSFQRAGRPPWEKGERARKRPGKFKFEFSVKVQKGKNHSSGVLLCKPFFAQLSNQKAIV